MNRSRQANATTTIIIFFVFVVAPLSLFFAVFRSRRRQGSAQTTKQLQRLRTPPATMQKGACGISSSAPPPPRPVPPGSPEVILAPVRVHYPSVSAEEPPGYGDHDAASEVQDVRSEAASPGESGEMGQGRSRALGPGRGKCCCSERACRGRGASAAPPGAGSPQSAQQRTSRLRDPLSKTR